MAVYVRQFRHKTGLSLKKLGALIPMSESNLSRVELGQRDVPISTALKISRALGIRLDYLFDDLPAEKGSPRVISESNDVVIGDE